MLLTGDIFCFFYYIKEVRNQEWIVEEIIIPIKDTY